MAQCGRSGELRAFRLFDVTESAEAPPRIVEPSFSI